MATRADVLKAIEIYFLLSEIDEHDSLAKIGLQLNNNANKFSDYLNREFKLKTNVQQILKASSVKDLLDDLNLKNKEEITEKNKDDYADLYAYIINIEEIEKDLMLLLIETKSVSDQFNELGCQIQSYSSSISKSSSELSKFIGKELKNYSKLTNNKKHALIGELTDSGSEVIGEIIGGTVKVFGEIVKGVGYLWQKHKEKKIKKEILNKKQELAFEKFDIVEKQYDRICNYTEKIEGLYIKNDVIVSLNDKMLENKICIFRSIFHLYTKVIYLQRVLEYVLNEFSSWIDGEQSSGGKKPVIEEVIEEFVKTTIDHLKENNRCTQKDILIELCQLDTTEECYISYLIFFADPYVFAKYINCNIGSLSSKESSALIKLWPINRYSNLDKKNGLFSTQIGSGTKSVLELNNYFIDCKKLISLKKNMLPKYPNYNIFDILLDISFLYGAYYCANYCWLNYSGWSFAGLITLLLLSMMIIQLVIRTSCLPLTYSKRKNVYYAKVNFLSGELNKIKTKYLFGITK